MILFLYSASSFGQNVDLANNLFGNEWIDYDKQYIKLRLSTDDIYRLSYDQLRQAGLPEGVEIQTIKIQNLGNTIPFYSSRKANQILAPGDYLLFYGEKNRAQLDQYLHQNPDATRLNDEYSVVSDTAAYFISWGHTSTPQIINEEEIDYTQTLAETRVYNHIEHRIFSTFHYKPVENRDLVRYSSFVAAEGFGTGLKKQITETFDVVDRINIGLDPKVSFRYGTNRNELNTKIKINGNDFISYFEAGYRNYVIDVDTTINYSWISDQMAIDFGTSGDASIQLADIRFEYTRTIDGAKEIPDVINLPPSQEDRYLRIKNYTGAALPVINLTNGKYYETVIQNNNLVIFVPQSNSAQDIALVNNSIESPNLEPVSFFDFSTIDHNFIFLTSQRLNNNEGGTNPIQDYVDYRQSSIGGSYDPVIVNVEDLYDQFAYGIDRHFLAIRHFAHYAKNNWSNVRFMFIIGKGREYTTQRHPSQLQDPLTPQMMVPTYGQPGSDNLLTRRVEEATLIFPTSRFAANTKEEVAQYLDKVRDHELNINNPQTIEDRLWMKKVLHLSGGSDDIQESIKMQLADMENVIESSKMGADVTTLARFSSTPIEQALSEGLLNLVNNGLALITFFGHSSTGVLDFDMGDINNYSNKGKTPLMIALGCNAGNIHGTSSKGLSETYVKIPSKGMVGFLASTGSAYAYQQYLYGQQLYNVLGNDNYGNPIGESINAIIDSFKYDTSLGVETFLEQVTLHGDPSITLHKNEASDFVPEGSSAKTVPLNVNSYEDKFTFCFDLANIGLSYKDSLDIGLKHFYPDGFLATDTVQRVGQIFYKKEVCFSFPILEGAPVGKHLIKVDVDINNEVNEFPLPFAEENNALFINDREGYEFFMLNNAAKPIFPMDFGITNNSRPKLIASTYNGLGKPVDYTIQFDTSGFFDSPSLVEETISNIKSSIEWDVPYNLTNNTVYYWRLSPIDTTTNSRIWEKSSFLYDENVEEGWNQSHYYQFLEDEYRNLVLSPSKRKIEFATDFQDLRIENKIYKNGDDRPHFYLNNVSKNGPFTFQISPGLSITLIDSVGRRLLTPFPETEYGTFNNRGKQVPMWLFQDLTNKETRQNIIRFLENEVENGIYVIINTVLFRDNLDFKTETWASDSLEFDNNIFTFFESLGAKHIRDFQEKGGLPYVFSYIQGKGPVIESIADSQEGAINVLLPFAGKWFEGDLTSTRIGPSSKWNSLIFNKMVEESDTVYLSIIGIENSGLEIPLKKVLINNLNSIDLSDIPENYSFLKLKFQSKDEENLTSALLNKWTVLFEGKADLFINNNGDINFYKDTLQQGDQLKLSLPIHNYTNYDIGTVEAEVVIKDNNNNQVFKNIDLGSFKSGETKSLNFSASTIDLLGDYLMNVTINPEKDPEENYYFNNFSSLSFNVFEEKINPVLDVTFDGVHILDGDIVSPEPMITISLKDENPFLLLQDSNTFELVILYPSGTEETIDLNDPRVLFTKATDEDNNVANLEFNPIFQEEGKYLLTVNSQDQTGNIAGENAFTIGFEVLLNKALSEVYNYPNPFSTSTEFIFTLTGSEVPEFFTIQIMTISGKVVKEISKEEFGPIRIGVNRSQYKWNGRDEFGSPLGNGVYLYRVLTSKADGSSFDKFDLGVESNAHFKKGWGKMVIIR